MTNDTQYKCANCGKNTDFEGGAGIVEDWLCAMCLFDHIRKLRKKVSTFSRALKQAVNEKNAFKEDLVYALDALDHMKFTSIRDGGPGGALYEPCPFCAGSDEFGGYGHAESCVRQLLLKKYGRIK